MVACMNYDTMEAERVGPIYLDHNFRLTRRETMEEVCTCKSCRGQAWTVYKDRIKCDKCGKEYKFSGDMPATALINLINDNY